MTDSPKVLSVVWNLIRGGTEGQCARLAIHLARNGHRHSVAVFRREGFFLDEVERACGPVYHVDIRRMLSPTTLAAVRDLARHIVRQRIQVVHAWDCDAAIFGSLASMAARVPLITSRRDLGQIYPAHKKWLMRRADMQARRVVVNADAIARGIEAEGVAAEKIVRVTNMLDLEEFDALAARPFPDAGQLPPGRMVGMVARLDPEKDGATFVRAASLVCAKHGDVCFVVAGDGVERPALEAQARIAGLGPRIAFLGDVRDVPALLRRFSIGVLVPSSNEGLSNTILEYMAAGLPVVATDCGGNRELVVDGENGFVVRARDAEGVAAALDRLIRDEHRARAMGATGRARVEAANKPAAVAESFLQLYRETV
jgi:glycosyltransferase involved in cell wall biosynthesis